MPDVTINDRMNGSTEWDKRAAIIYLESLAKVYLSYFEDETRGNDLIRARHIKDSLEQAYEALEKNK